jgi:aspartyl-tRNA(Asn)/glutamyl-tRNA(Gln) amidotransferase subunit C
MDKKGIESLAKLARIDLTEDEKERLTKEFGEILSYVDTIKKVSEDAPDLPKPQQYNVFREDTVTHDSGVDTETLLSEAPDREGDYLKVKKIL